jgi:predicted metal-dependent phosphoesterase TrpH
VDDGDSALVQHLARFRASRLERLQSMLARLRDLGMALSWERVCQLGGEGSIGRPHVARAMVEAGYVGDARQAFERYLGRGKAAYVPRLKVTPVEAVHLIRAAGGLPVLAHPWDLLRIVPELVAEGLVGLEAYYAGYSAIATDYLRQVAQEHGLVCTGGSDFHGLALLPNAVLGSSVLPPECVRALYALEPCLAAVPKPSFSQKLGF